MKLTANKLNAILILVFSLNFRTVLQTGSDYSYGLKIQQGVQTKQQEIIPTYKKECIEISKSGKMNLDGKIIVHQPAGSILPVVFDLTTEEHQPFYDGITMPAFDFAVSPDGENFSYIQVPDGNFEKISLVTESIRNGKRNSIKLDQKEIMGEGRITNASWLNNDQMAIGYSRDDQFTDIWVFDPVSQSFEEMKSDFPNIVASDQYWMGIWPSVIIFSPGKRYAVYLAEDQKNSAPGFQSLVLWDLKKNKEITRIENYGYTIVSPVWKSDENGVFLVKNTNHGEYVNNIDEILFLETDGTITKITDLESIYQINYRIDKMVLSPDGTELAIGLRTNLKKKAQNYTLGSINLATKETVDYCVELENGNLVWSPDSTKLAIPDRLGEGLFGTVILDIKDLKGMALTANSTPLIWIKNSSK